LETERYFKESADFIKRIGFASLHVFSYSPRAGTAAAKMPPLAPAIIKARSKELHNIDKELRIAFAKKQIGSRREMLCEEFRDGALSGVLSNFQRAVIPAAAAGFAKQKGLIEVNIEGAQDDICIASLARYETLTTI
jgi:threonylcarbamoyladenosine tRNA methylthiotransferase MtaB